MKKSIKRTAAAILAVATTAGVAGTTVLSFNATNRANGTNVVKADTVTAKDNTLVISSYDKVVKLGDSFTMPTAKFYGVGGTETTLTEYTVTTPTGGTFTQENVTDGKFKVDEIGEYTITYVSGNYKGEVTFEVETTTYNVKLVENNANILPNKIAVKDKNNVAFTGELNVPTCKVTDENGDEVDAIVEISVTKPDFTTENITESKKIVFNSENPIEIGYYIVTYKAYSKKDGAKDAYLGEVKTEFSAVSADSYKNEYDLTIVYGSEKPKSVNVGKTIELPAVTAKNGTEAVPVYYEVKVYKNGATDPISEEVLVGNTDKKVITKNDKGVYEFTADEVGVYYRVQYTVKDALGNTKTAEFNIDTVEDSLNPTPIVVDAYATDVATLKTLKNKDYALKSMFGQIDGVQEDIVIKAIYAEDLGTFNYNDFKFERRIENSSRELVYKSDKFEDACKEIVFNHTGDALDATKYITVPAETATLKDGYYYVYYTVTDAHKNKATVSYKFTVDKNFDWKDASSNDIKPTVKFNDTFYSSIELGEKVEFGDITASDEKDDRLETKVYYTYTVDGVEGEAIDLKLNDDNKYVIDTSAKKNDTNRPTKLTIYAKAINDGGKETIEKKEITLNSEVLGTAVPSVYDVDDAGYSYTYVQGAKITVPTIKFQDGADGVDSLNTNITVKCTTADDKVINYTAQNAMAIKVGGYLVYSNASFVAATAGTYQVAIKVTDAAGNAVVKFLTYTVTDASYTGELRFEDLGISENNELELGKAFKLQVAKITGEHADEYDYYVVCTESEGAYKLNNSEFVPNAKGAYKLKYVMYEKANPENTVDEFEFKVTVKDTVGPEINVVWETERVNDSTGRQSIQAAYEKGTKILIPKFSAKDLSGIDTEKSTIVISSKNTTRTIKYSEMNKKYEDGKTGSTQDTMFYTFNNDAEYTVTYTAYDKEGNTSSKSYTIKIGDLVAPTLTVSDKIVNSTYKSGQVITIDLEDTKNYIKVSDNKTTLEKQDVVVKLYLNGTEIKKADASTDTKFIFNLKDAGEYELRFTATDDAGLTTTVTKTFTIQDKATSNMTSTEIIGTVLIVVSVAVLAGVVVYFIVSKKKMDKLYKG